MKKSLKMLTLGLLALSASVGAVKADSVTLAATAGASGLEGNPTYPNAASWSDNFLEVGSCGYNQSPNPMTSQVAFSTASLTGLGSVTVSAASLTLTSGIANRSQQVQQIDLYELVPANAGFNANGNWATKDGSTAWAGGSSGASVAGTDYVNVLLGSATTPTGGLNLNQALTFTLNTAGLAVIQNIVNGADTNPGFELITDPSSASSDYNLCAFYDGGASGPQLSVTYAAVPEPSTWAMLLGGLGMLTMFRRRRA